MFKEDYKEYQKHIHPSRRMTEKILKRSKRQMKKANPVYRLAPLCLLILLFASPFVLRAMRGDSMKNSKEETQNQEMVKFQEFDKESAKEGAKKEAKEEKDLNKANFAGIEQLFPSGEQGEKEGERTVFRQGKDEIVIYPVGVNEEGLPVLQKGEVNVFNLKKFLNTEGFLIALSGEDTVRIELKGSEKVIERFLTAPLLKEGL